jgi:predicted alpha/beta-hydrolase family hydrolase
MAKLLHVLQQKCNVLGRELAGPGYPPDMHGAPTAESLKFSPTPTHGDVSALWSYPAQPRYVLCLGHGAGSTLQHRLMEQLSAALNERGVASLRFNYPYSERGRGMDSEPTRLATVRAAAALARERAGGLPLFAGGHSMSGRMFTTAAAREPLPGVRGLVCFAFPLHSGAPDTARAVHLGEVRVPLLFVSGTRDKMAEPELLKQVVAGLASAELHALEGADHSFAASRRRQSSEPVLAEAARVTEAWMARVALGPHGGNPAV